MEEQEIQQGLKDEQLFFYLDRENQCIVREVPSKAENWERTKCPQSTMRQFSKFKLEVLAEKPENTDLGQTIKQPGYKLNS